MKFLHLWRVDQLFKSSQPLSDPRQITFVMLNRFWSLSKSPLTPLFLTDNIKLDGLPTKIKWKIQASFTFYFKFWESVYVKGYKIQLSVLLFLVLHQFLYQQISRFTTFRNFVQHYLKKVHGLHTYRADWGWWIQASSVPCDQKFSCKWNLSFFKAIWTKRHPAPCNHLIQLLLLVPECYFA